MENIYNAIQNVYNMDKTTWQEVLAELYNLVSKVENKFDLFELKFGSLLGEQVTIELKKMYDDGSLASLINDKLLKDINTKVDAFKTEVSEQLDNKASVFNLEPYSKCVELIAHRGAETLAPENTIPAFEIASKQGYKYVETDVHELADGNFIVFHDFTVDRMTNGIGNTRDLTLNEFKSLIIDSGANVSQFNTLRTPTLQEFLKCCKNNDLIPVIEVKTLWNTQNFMNILDEYNMINNVILITFEQNYIENIRKISKSIKMQYLSNTLTQTEIDFCIKNKCDVGVNHSVFPSANSLVETCHKNDIKVGVWTITNLTDYNKCITAGVDNITTDSLLGNTNNFINSYYNRLLPNVIQTIKIGNHNGVGHHYTNVFGNGSTNRGYCENKIYIPFNKSKITPYLSEDYKCSFIMFNSNDIFLKDGGWVTNGNTFTFESDTEYFCVYFARVDNATLTNDDIRNLMRFAYDLS